MLLLALVAVGVWLRLWHLGSRRLGFDEAFTAMAARRPPDSLFRFLRTADSHPPLSYLWRSPFVFIGVSDFWVRFPSAVCSIAALVLFASWMRRNGWTGVAAIGLFALNTFQVVHGREVRMYAELELVGVAAAFLSTCWLQRPRPWHSYAIGLLTLAGLLTHVSTLLLGAGLLAIAGRRTDREAWRWRAALAAGLTGWAVLWGPSFLRQARTGHSDWIPRTSATGLVQAVGGLVTTMRAWQLVAVVVVVAGGVVICRRGGITARVWTCCFVVPVGLAAGSGLLAPVLLDRTLTVASWGAVFALAALLGSLARRLPRAGVVVTILVLVLGVPSAVGSITRASTPDVVLRHIQDVAVTGDVLAVHPARRRPELVWPFAVTLGRPTRVVHVRGLPRVAAVELGTGPPRGRVWLLEWRPRSRLEIGKPRCAPDWHHDKARVLCLARSGTR